MNDQQLWQSLKDGREDALERIYREHVDALLRYGRQFSTDVNLVQDCIHDLFVELWRNRSGLGDNDNIRPYLLVALRRKVIRRIKKLQKTQNEWDNKEVEFLAIPAIDASIIDREISEANSTALKKAMTQLSKRQREALYLKYFEEMSYEEICEALEINYQSVRNLVSAGLKALRKYMTIFWLFLAVCYWLPAIS